MVIRLFASWLCYLGAIALIIVALVLGYSVATSSEQDLAQVGVWVNTGVEATPTEVAFGDSPVNPPLDPNHPASLAVRFAAVKSRKEAELDQLWQKYKVLRGYWWHKYYSAEEKQPISIRLHYEDGTSEELRGEQ